MKQMCDYRCPDCGWELVDTLVDRDDPPVHHCPECDTTCDLIQGVAKGVPRPMRRSYRDGTNRWPLLKEKSKLELEKVNTDYRDPRRKEIDKEIRKIESGTYKKEIK